MLIELGAYPPYVDKVGAYPPYVDKLYPPYVDNLSFCGLVIIIENLAVRRAGLFLSRLFHLPPIC